MSKPNLIVIAGCNGSGKSTYSKSLVPKHIVPFDADKLKKEIYDSFTFDFEFREKMAWNKTQDEFERSVKAAIQNKNDFAYETNFNHAPLHWVTKFEKAKYITHLLFFSLKNIKLAKERVAIRFQNGGHYVSDEEIASRYTAGFNNLDKYYSQFDSIMILESSAENKRPVTLFSYKDNKTLKAKNTLPLYFKRNCPSLTKFILNS